jgi:hypothetical protein
VFAQKNNYKKKDEIWLLCFKGKFCQKCDSVLIFDNSSPKKESTDPLCDP